MKTLGQFTAVVLWAGAIVAVGVGLRSIPDVQRYIKMRNM